MTNLVMHNWNGHQIGQAASDFTLNKKLVPAGYVDLTAIAAVGGKTIWRFLELDSTKTLIEALSNNLDKTEVLAGSEIPGFFDSIFKPNPVVSIPGRNGGTYGCIEVAIKVCAWINVEFEVWGLRTLTKVITGQEVTNADRSEGWGRVAAMGVEVESRNSTPPISPDKDVLALNATLAATTGEGLSRAEIIGKCGWKPRASRTALI